MPPVPNLSAFYFTAIRFRVTGQFETSASNDPQMTLNTKVKGTPYTHYDYPQVPNLTLPRSTVSRFRVTGHFETHAPNDAKMTVNIKRSQVPHICVTTSPKCQSSIRFAQRPAVFELQAILRQVHRMTPR